MSGVLVWFCCYLFDLFGFVGNFGCCVWRIFLIFGRLGIVGWFNNIKVRSDWFINFFVNILFGFNYWLMYLFYE